MSEIILVQGANGNTGSATLQQLIAQAGPNIKLRAGVRKLGTDQTKDWASKGVEVVELDSEKPDTLVAAFKGVTRAFIVPPNLENRAHITGVLVQAAKAAGVRHLVLISVFNAQTESFIFARQLREAERHVETSGLEWTILRPIFFLENLYGWAAGIKSGGLYLGIREGRLAPISTVDIGRAGAAALLHPAGHVGKHYDLTGPALVSGAEIAAALAAATGHAVNFVSPPEAATRDSLKQLGVQPWQIEGYLDLFEHFATHKAETVATGVQELTGSAPISTEAWTQLHRAGF